MSWYSTLKVRAGSARIIADLLLQCAGLVLHGFDRNVSAPWDAGENNVGTDNVFGTALAMIPTISSRIGVRGRELLLIGAAAVAASVAPPAVAAAPARESAGLKRLLTNASAGGTGASLSSFGTRGSPSRRTADPDYYTGLRFPVPFGRGNDLPGGCGGRSWPSRARLRMPFLARMSVTPAPS
jgi:hypothetical protein